MITDISAEPRPLEQLQRDAVMKQRLRDAGLPLVTTADDDVDLLRAVYTRDLMTAQTCAGLHVDAAVLRCRKEQAA